MTQNIIKFASKLNWNKVSSYLKLAEVISPPDRLELLRYLFTHPHFIQNDVSKINPFFHSHLVNQILGLSKDRIEKDLVNLALTLGATQSISQMSIKLHGTQTWVGLGGDVLQTPYLHLFELSKTFSFEGIKSVIDVGFGYGRVGIFLHHMNKNIEFIGYEIVEERYAETLRLFRELGMPTNTLYLKNFLDLPGEIPRADMYFSYDFSNADSLTLFVDKLNAAKHSFFLAAHGARLKDIVLRNPRSFALVTEVGNSIAVFRKI